MARIKIVVIEAEGDAGLILEKIGEALAIRNHTPRTVEPPKGAPAPPAPRKK